MRKINTKVIGHGTVTVTDMITFFVSDRDPAAIRVWLSDISSKYCHVTGKSVTVSIGKGDDLLPFSIELTENRSAAVIEDVINHIAGAAYITIDGPAMIGTVEGETIRSYYFCAFV